MQFQKVFYRFVTTAAGFATVALGTDTAPTTAYGTPGAAPQAPGTKSAANVDNVLSCRVNGISAPVACTRIAVCMVGPTGAASQNANLYVWDQGTAHWYLVNAAPISLVNNQLVFFDAVSPCEAPTTQGQTISQGGVDYMLVVAASTPTAGQYLFAMSALLNVP